MGSEPRGRYQRRWLMAVLVSRVILRPSLRTQGGRGALKALLGDTNSQTGGDVAFVRSGALAAATLVMAWLRPANVWAPAEETAKEGAFMHALATGGGRIAARRWSGLLLPERHQDVRARDTRRRYPRPSVEHGDVIHAPEAPSMALMGMAAQAIRTSVWQAGAGGAIAGLPLCFHVLNAMEWDTRPAATQHAAVVLAENHPRVPILAVDLRDFDAAAAALRSQRPYHFVQASLLDAGEAKRGSFATAVARLLVWASPRVFSLRADREAKKGGGDEWKRVVTKAGFALTMFTVESRQCGLPQASGQRLVLGVRGNETAAIVTAFKGALRRHAGRGRFVPRSIARTVPGVGKMVWWPGTRKHPRVLCTSGVGPRLTPRAWMSLPRKLKPGAGDASFTTTADIHAFSPAERGMLQGFPAHYLWRAGPQGSPADRAVARAQASLPCRRP